LVWQSEVEVTFNGDIHLDIKRRLSDLGKTFAEIAEQEGVSKVSVSIVSQGYRRSRRIEAAIARAVNCTPEELWPERYPSK
jgi:lambda repressor-like predicted transcriptional regulator